MATAALPEIVLPPLHPRQLEIARHPARYKVVCCGRRWGKTVLGVTVCTQSAIKGKRVWWVAPVYSVAKEGWDMARRLARQMPKDFVHIKEQDRMLEFAGGGRFEVRSADDPDHLRGAGLDGLVLDEAATIKKRETWFEVLQPTLLDKKGWALFISTPKGKNWYWELFENAARIASEAEAKNAEPLWKAWQSTTYDNVFVDSAEIDAMREQMSEEEFQQEVMANFLVAHDAIYPMFNRRRHMLPLNSKVEWRGGAVGGDYGDNHPSTSVAVTIDGDNRYWVRAAWWGDGDTGKWVGQMTQQCADYRISRRRIRLDPNQGSIAKAYGFNHAFRGGGTRPMRIGLVKSLLNSGGLYFDINGPGMLRLADEIEMYHWDKEADGRTLKDQPDRDGEDGVAALEYAIEELLGQKKADYSKKLTIAGSIFPAARVAR